jgi:hypothetical protein
MDDEQITPKFSWHFHLLPGKKRVHDPQGVLEKSGEVQREARSWPPNLGMLPTKR